MILASYPLPSGWVSDCASMLSHLLVFEPYALAKSILIPFGEYFEIQDDFLDFSGAPEQIGKIVTDILDNKCSWCMNTALAVCTPEQRRVLDENYRRKDSECERRVKEI